MHETSSHLGIVFTVSSLVRDERQVQATIEACCCHNVPIVVGMKRYWGRGREDGGGAMEYILITPRTQSSGECLKVRSPSRKTRAHGAIKVCEGMIFF